MPSNMLYAVALCFVVVAYGSEGNKDNDVVDPSNLAIASKTCDSEATDDSTEFLQHSLHKSAAPQAHEGNAGSQEAVLAASSGKRVKRTSNTGKIDALYTFGSPTVSKSPLKNEQSRNGCFNGKRVIGYTLENEIDGVCNGLITRPYTAMHEIVNVHVDVEHKFGQGQVPNAWTDSEAEQIQYYGTEDYKSCSKRSAGTPIAFKAVHLDDEKGLELHDIGYWFNYSDPLLIKMWALASAWKAPCQVTRYGINQVSAVEVTDPWGTANGYNDIDSVHLFQDSSSLKCYLVFRPVDHESDMMEIMKTDWRDKTWCDKKHNFGKHFVEELMALQKSPQWKPMIQDKLPKCSGVEVAGHSMGGALGSIMASCLNKNAWEQDTYADYLWEFGTPELLDFPSDQCAPPPPQPPQQQ
jgi:hypothetical protein